VNAATHARSLWTQLRAQHCIASGIGVLAVVVGSLLLAAPASASGSSHAFAASFGATSSTPANPHPLSGPTDIDVDQASHAFYVTDPGNHRVEKFDAAGNFLLMFGKGVDQTSGGNVCTEASGDTCKAGTSSANSGGFDSPEFVAVDNTGGPSSGDVYVGDTGDNVVQKFNPSGQVISSWGAGGQKDGSDATDLPGFGPLAGVAVGGPTGTLYVAGTHYSDDIWTYTQNGTYIRWYATGGLLGLSADQDGNFYYAAPGGLFGPPTVWESIPIGENQDTNSYQVGTDSPVAGIAFDPSTQELYQNTESAIDHYNSGCTPPPSGPCDPADSFGSGHLSGPVGLAADGTSHTVYVANSGSNDVAVFNDIRPIVTTGAPTGLTESDATLTGHIDPAGRGDITSCHFEYGFDKTYGSSVPCSPDPASVNFTGPTDVTATVTGFSPGTKNHYRLVASNAAGGTSNGVDQTFTTTQPPSVDGLASANLTATTADLNAQVNPNGLDTTYRFEYGLTISYGQSAPVPDGTISASSADQAISVHLDSLIPQNVYHYRLVATNIDGTTTTGDQTFNFYPPSCPNENVRQQTKANYLPDCRAYEIVSPGDAGGTQLYAFGPNSGHATNPSRFSFTGLFSTIPNSGGSPIDGTGDLYVATRTGTGWVSRYVGWPSDEAAVDGGPPMGPPGSSSQPYQPYPSNMSANGGSGPGGQNGVITNLSMDKFLSFNDGNQSIESIFGADFQNHTPIASIAPKVIAADGTLLGRWPTNLGAVPDGSYPAWQGIYPYGGYPDEGAQALTTAPGGSHALDCPATNGSFQEKAANNCPGDVTGSADLNHFVFATEWNVFAPGGQLSPPGSVYDNNTATGTVVVASKAPGGGDIASEPTDKAGDPLQIPAVSSNGSHILMAAGGNGPCGFANCPYPPCGDYYSAVVRCAMQPSHLYMRVDGAVTYDVSQGHDVNYVGTSGDGSKVYYSSDQQLTTDDTDNSIDLYMWSEATNSITRVSAGNNGAGNSDACSVGFTAKCGVATFSTQSYCENVSGYGGNCISDNSIAAESGDLFFFSPEQLDGSRGIANHENLYDFRNGHVQYVTTFPSSSPYCFTLYGYYPQCQPVQIVRMQVSPDGGHMAFVTAGQVTGYDNAGHLEMYVYDASTQKVVCVSCIPSGAPPISDVQASQDGLFMTDDGRAFFSTEDPLVSTDTNQALDIYEYVEGRAQLISPGTGDTKQARLTFFATNSPGLIGVSADGRDVYFATFDTLVRQDHNGLFLKFYDARTGGGFPAPAPPPPCSAADECHGAGSGPSAATRVTSNGAPTNGGNAKPRATKKHRNRKRHKRSPARHVHTNRRAGE
jgi:hypothetical protein